MILRDAVDLKIAPRDGETAGDAWRRIAARILIADAYAGDGDDDGRGAVEFRDAKWREPGLSVDASLQDSILSVRIDGEGGWDFLDTDFAGRATVSGENHRPWPPAYDAPAAGTDVPEVDARYLAKLEKSAESADDLGCRWASEIPAEKLRRAIGLGAKLVTPAAWLVERRLGIPPGHRARLVT